MLPIAILVSGSGTNLQAILDEISADPDYGAKPVLVISDRPEVLALDRAARSGVPTMVVDWADFDSRDTFTAAVCDAVEESGAEAIVLAGFMRILGQQAVERFSDRILNIHPALLPSFLGPHAIRDALAAGVKVTGVTIHFVDEKVDHGPIVAQQAIPVYPHDTEESLQQRIQAIEHMLYPDVIKALAHGELVVDGNKVTWQ